jgi:hypothetical protein
MIVCIHGMQYIGYVVAEGDMFLLNMGNHNDATSQYRRAEFAVIPLGES